MERFISDGWSAGLEHLDSWGLDALVVVHDAVEPRVVQVGDDFLDRLDVPLAISVGITSNNSHSI